MGRKLALVIGNSEYDDASLARLITPSEDVTDLANLLKLSDIGSFDEVITLVNESATTLRRSIAKLFAQKTPDDLVLLYFSGHGVLDDQGHLYLAVKDTERELLSGTAIPSSFITGEMDRSRSRRQVLVLDCCHSGAFARGSKGVVGASVGTASAFEGTGYGRVVLTATDATQYAWEGERVIGQADNSVFTHFMIQGLETGAADQDQDGRITLDELYDYVYAQVVAQTPKQTPGKWSYRQHGEIVIAKNPHPAVAQAAELPGELKQAIESPFASVREGAVRELAALLRGSSAGLALAAREALQHLSEDDSRKVSIAAAEALKTGLSAPPIEVVPTPAPARATPQSAAALVPIVAATPVETRLVDQERTVEPEAAAEPAVAAELTSATIAHVETQKSPVAAAPLSVVLQRTLIVSGGWIAGWISGLYLASLIDSNLVSLLILSASWGIAALITGLILRRVVPSLKNYHIAILISVWALVPLAGILTQGGGGSGDDYITKPNLIVSIAFTWLMNSWFVLQMPPGVMWWQAVVVGAAGAVGWVSGGMNSWYIVALYISGRGSSLPAALYDSGVRIVTLLSNVILSGLVGGGVLAIVHELTQKQTSPPPSVNVHSGSLETKNSSVLTTVGGPLAAQQRTALLAGLIVSVGWFAGWLAGILIGSLWNESSSGAKSLGLGWAAAGVMTGIVLRRVTHSAWWPLASLGAGWLLCLVLSFYLNAPGLILLAVVVTWLISSLTALLVVRNHNWLIAGLTGAAAGIVWIILGNRWDLVALKFFGANYHWALATFLDAEPYGVVDLLLVPAVTAAVAGSILTLLLYRRAEATHLSL